MTRLVDALARAQETARTGPRPALIPTVGRRIDGTTDPDVPASWDLDHPHEPPAPAVQSVVVQTADSGSAQAPEAAIREEAKRTAPIAVDPVVAPPPSAAPRGGEIAPARTFSRHASKRSDKLVDDPGASAALVEQFRHLAAALHHSQLGAETRIVMVASAVKAEGKTLTAANIALTLSESYQKRVLLIDADLRAPSVHALFSLDNHTGLSEVLKERVSGPLPVRQVSETLWILTAGPADADPMSGLVSETMSRLLADAIAEFDWIVIDTPPVAVLPDANLLAAMVDVALLVVSANTTPYPLVTRAVEAIGRQKILGVVLNRADEAHVSFRYGQGYLPYGTAEPETLFDRFRLAFSGKRPV
jgi:capsular exopolysaccharide synthesis family protein